MYNNKCIVFSIIYIFIFHFSSYAFSDQTSYSEECKSNTAFSMRYHETIGEAHIKKEETLKACTEALKNNPSSLELQFSLARVLLLDGQIKKANKILLDLHYKGFNNATLYLADSYYFGEYGKIRDFGKFYELHKIAYDRGSKWAALGLFYAYRDGLGVSTDLEKARNYLIVAADAGSSEAVVRLAEAYLYGFIGFEQNIEEGKNLLAKEIAYYNEDASAVYHEWQIFNSDNPTDILISLNSLEELSNNNNVAASLALVDFNLISENDFGIIRDNKIGFSALMRMTESINGLQEISPLIVDALGDSLNRDQIDKLISRLDTLANDSSIIDTRSSIIAARELAYIFEWGLFYPVDKLKAIHYYKIAAEQHNDYYSYISIGWEYYSNSELKDYLLAIEYFRKATKSDNFDERSLAHNNLGVVFERISNETRDKIEKKNYILMAESEYLKSIEYMDKEIPSYLYPFENLSRLYLVEPNLQDLNKAKHFAALAEKYFDMSFFYKFINYYSFENNITIEQYKEALINYLNIGNYGAATELVYWGQNYGTVGDEIKWLTVCISVSEQQAMQECKSFLDEIKSNTRGSLFYNSEYEGLEFVRALLDKNPKNKEFDTVKYDNVENLSYGGNLYVLLIGVQNYSFFEKLKTPINDVSAIGEVFENSYNAEVIYLNNPSRKDITKELNRLVNLLDNKDNLIIYYAGHGVIDNTGEGYWLPIDAEVGDDTNYISNSYIRNKLKSSNATNILLVVDSCFSGSILTRGISNSVDTETDKNIFQKYINTKSRIAITSGGLSPVLDGGGGQNSIFAKSFIDAIRNNKKPFTSTDLYLNVRDNVTSTSLIMGIDQTPQIGELIADGHEGPDFVLLPN